ncbi:MAG: RNA chaperone Hfq [Fischerella sp. CENA71]|nr:RNA chaperone Hfq [Fischerella sp. CENA71]
MITEFDTSLPSTRQLQNLIKEAVPTEIKLLTGDILTGRVMWQDQCSMCLVDDHNQQVIIWKQAIAYLKPLSN